MASILDHIRELLARTPPFDAMDDEAREALRAELSVVFFEADDVIIAQGAVAHKGLYLIESGEVRLLDADKHRPIARLSAGDLFGVFHLVKGGSALYEAKALVPTTCALLPTAAFRTMMQEHQAVATHFERDARRLFRILTTETDVGGSHLLRRPLGDLPLGQLVMLEPGTSVQEAAQAMTTARTDYALIAEDGVVTGLVTDADLRTRVLARGRSLDQPVHSVAQLFMDHLPASATVLDALMDLLEERRGYVLVTQGDKPLGVLTERHLSHFMGKDPVATARFVEQAPGKAIPASVRAEHNEQLQTLHQQGVGSEQLSRIASGLQDRFSIAAIEHAMAALAADGQAMPDVAWAWFQVGSSGRREMALTSDLHHALVYEAPRTAVQRTAVAAYFEALADRAAEILAEAGFTAHEVSATDAAYNAPLSDWVTRYKGWLTEPEAIPAPQLTRFFDLRTVYGTPRLVATLRQTIRDTFAKHPEGKARVLAHLATELHRRNVAREMLTRLRSLRATPTYDVRGQGMLPLIDAARLMALACDELNVISTPDRLRHVLADDRFADMRPPLEAALDAFHLLTDIRLEVQFRQAEVGDAPGNDFSPSHLTALQLGGLRNAFKAITTLQDLLAKRYRKGRDAKA